MNHPASRRMRNLEMDTPLADRDAATASDEHARDPRADGEPTPDPTPHADERSDTPAQGPSEPLVAPRRGMTATRALHEAVERDLADPFALTPEEDRMTRSETNTPTPAAPPSTFPATRSRVEHAVAERYAQKERGLADGPMASTDAPPPTRRGLLQAFVHHTGAMLGRRRSAMRSALALTMVSATTVAAWYAIAARDARGRGTGDEFAIVYDLAHAADRFAWSPSSPATQIGGDYLAGAREGERVLLDRWYQAVTHPEPRLAVLAAQGVRALETDNTAAMADVLQRLEWLPGHASDARVALLRQSLFAALEDHAATLDPNVARRFAQRAQAQERVIAAHAHTVPGGDWSPEVLEQLRRGLAIALQDVHALAGRSAEFKAGYRAAIGEAARYHKLITTRGLHR